MSQLLIHDLPDTERPRERLERLGAEALSDLELLAILLRTGVQGESAIVLANEIMKAGKGTLDGVARLSLHELLTINGMGKTKAVTLMAAFELAKRRMEVTTASPAMTHPKLVADYCRSRIKDDSREELHILMLDIKLRVTKDEVVSTGLLDRSLVHPREVYRLAIRNACHQIILWHNHPSGDCRPSGEDDDITRQILIAGKILGIEMADHLVIGRPGHAPYSDGYFSYKESGRLLKILEP